MIDYKCTCEQPRVDGNHFTYGACPGCLNLEALEASEPEELDEVMTFALEVAA